MNDFQGIGVGSSGWFIGDDEGRAWFEATQLKVKFAFASTIIPAFHPNRPMYPEKETSSFSQWSANARRSDMAKQMCRCCGEARPSVKNRNRISRKYRDSGAPVWMCDGCWEDPAILKSECSHDEEAAARAARIRARLAQVWPDGALRPATDEEFAEDGMPLRVHHQEGEKT